MQRSARLAWTLVLSMAACTPPAGPKPGGGGTGGVTGGSGGGVGTGGQPGFGGSPGAGGQPGTGGQSGMGGGTGGAGQGGSGGTGGQTGGAGGRDAGPGGAGGRGGTGGAGSDARPADSAPTTPPAGDGGVAALDMYCTPKVVLNVGQDSGGQRFMMALGGNMAAVIATVQQMGREICRYLYRSVDEVRMANEIEIIVDPAYDGIAAKSGNVGKVRVRYGANYIANYNGDVAREVKGILYHEMTHIYQHDDKPEGTWPGLAEYYESHADAVRTHFGHSSCGAPNKGGTWDRGAYCGRAHFWLWLENTYPGFLHKLNLQMKGGDGMPWTPARGAMIAGKPMETLFEEYKAAACCAGSNRACCM